MIKVFDCIVCPMSCHIEVEMSEDVIHHIKGNTCVRGEQFVRDELRCPMRMITTTIRIHHGLHPLLPVITSQNIPKDKIFDIMNICKTLEVDAPITYGTIIVKDIANTGVDLIASKSMEMRKSPNETEDSSCYRRL